MHVLLYIVYHHCSSAYYEQRCVLIVSRVLDTSILLRSMFQLPNCCFPRVLWGSPCSPLLIGRPRCRWRRQDPAGINSCIVSGFFFQICVGNEGIEMFSSFRVHCCSDGVTVAALRLAVWFCLTREALVVCIGDEWSARETLSVLFDGPTYVS